MERMEQQALALDETVESAPAPPPRRRVPLPKGYDVAECRYCGRRILWATMLDKWGDVRVNPQTGKIVRNPIDPQPTEKGRLRLVGNGRAVPAARGEVLMPDQAYQSHWATCPAAPRKGRRR